MAPRIFDFISADWADYLEVFHTQRAGITEEVLSRAVSGQQNPYRWLARAVSARAMTVLDVACGSGAMSRELAREGRQIIGVDISLPEVRQASQRSAGPFVQADALRLPFADESFDVVVSSLGLAVVRPISQMLAEVSRVLRPGGVFAAMVPTVRPLGLSDMIVATRLAAILRTTPRFPGTLELIMDSLLTESDLKRVEDLRQCYRFPVRVREDAEMLIAALYLPKTKNERYRAAIDYLTQESVTRGVIDVPLPMRRIITIK